MRALGADVVSVNHPVAREFALETCTPRLHVGRSVYVTKRIGNAGAEQGERAERGAGGERWPAREGIAQAAPGGYAVAVHGCVPVSDRGEAIDSAQPRS